MFEGIQNLILSEDMLIRSTGEASSSLISTEDRGKWSPIEGVGIVQDRSREGEVDRTTGENYRLKLQREWSFQKTMLGAHDR